MDVDVSEILRILANSRRPKSGREIAASLGVSPRQKQEVYRLLHELTRSGEVRKMRGGRFLLAKTGRPQRGELRMLRNGSAIVAVHGGTLEIRVPERALFGALHGDTVEVVSSGAPRGGRTEGRIVRIVTRRQKELVGLFREQGGRASVAPVDGGSQTVHVSGPMPTGLTSGQVVVVALDAPSATVPTLSGKIVEILGAADDPAVEMRIIARRFGIPEHFPEAVVAAAKQVAQTVSPEECAGRRDLRDLPFVTIDGETAKDFDDAVALVVEPAGRMCLYVAIADVAHYVAEGSPIDKEAQLRGTSVYFPGVCLPMLPEALSNGICSLNPQVDRLVVCAELQFGRDGAVEQTDFCEAVINSRARLTYTGVQQVLDQKAVDEQQPEHLRQLPLMCQLAEQLTRRRLQRGALDLEIPEPEIRLDAAGQPLSIERAERNAAHRLIEEFMLAANEAVALELTVGHFPLLYRVHEPPREEDLVPFFTAARRAGAAVGDAQGRLPARLQSVLASLDDPSTAEILNRMLLRSLKQAFYHPENRGHFGLASEHYCHFTSPIRRYPDLLVHRMLKQKLAGASGEQLQERLKERMQVLAELTSKTERRAVDAERDALAFKSCQYMVKHVGEIFDGHVTSVHPFGFFVELDPIFVEGMVHVSSLHDDYYRFDDETSRLIGETHNRLFAIGTPVTVKISSVNVARREIDFSLDTDQGESIRRRPLPRRKQRRRY